MEIVKLEKNELIIPEGVIEQLQEFERLKVKVELVQKQIKEDLKEAMEKYKIESWESEDKVVTATLKKPYTRKSIDSARLKKELPDIAKEYEKEIQVSSSLTLSVKC
jgi:hypothetical protein